MHSIHDSRALTAAWRAGRFDPYLLRRLRAALYRRFLPLEQALAGLPERQRAWLCRQVDLAPLRLVERHDSRIDGATRLLFAGASGQLIETVLLRIASGRTSICLSSQVGCAVGCPFCATGRLGLIKNLSASEIVDQALQAARLAAGEGRRARNIVLMGMGEPFHNEKQVFAALEVLADRDCWHWSLRRITVSTIGVPEAMIRCTRRFPDIRLAVSLHSARSDVRAGLIPWANKYPLPMLRQALDEVARIGGQTLMIEYVMLRDVNDSPHDLQALIDYLRGLPAHVNLIPYNRSAGLGAWESSSAARIQSFAQGLKAAGFPATVRRSLGPDIAAACGQLASAGISRNAADPSGAGSR